MRVVFVNTTAHQNKEKKMRNNATHRRWSKLPCEVQDKQYLILSSETVLRFVSRPSSKDVAST
jgi:hypothetical protein